MQKLPLPDEVKEALAKLDEAGYESWLVGGVRDLLLQRAVHDWDITTSATPEEIKQVFADFPFHNTGEKYGTICVHYKNSFLDITTFRKEGDYQDRRHPNQVQFTQHLFEDLKRRDFTVNAIVYHPEKGFRDFFCGKRDLRRHLIRAIGDADARFSQDAVRILRALRFASTLGFVIEEKTKEALHRNKELLKGIAPERVLPEFVRMLCGKNIRYILSEFSDVIGVLVPEILPAVGFSQHSPFHQYDVWEHTLHAIGFSEAKPDVRLALLFHDISKPECLTVDATGRGHFYSHPKKSAKICREVMNRMKFPAKQIDLVSLLVFYHDSHPASDADIKKLLGNVGEEHFFTLIRVMEADTLAHSKWTVKKRLGHVHEIESRGRAILERGECFSLKTLAVKGNDLEAMGLRGERVGRALQFALGKVISGEWDNEKEKILGELAKNNW